MLHARLITRQQGLSFTKEGDYIRCLKPSKPALKPSWLFGIDIAVDPCGNKKVGVGVLPVKEHQNLRRVYGGYRFVRSKPVLYLYRSFFRDSGGDGAWRGGRAAGLAFTPHGVERLRCTLTTQGVEVPVSPAGGSALGACGVTTSR